MIEWIEVVEWSDALSERVSACDVSFIDIDDVVLTSDDYFIGSSTWASMHFKRNAQSYTRPELIEHFYQALEAANFKPVDPALNAFLSELATQKPVLGLTARMPFYIEETQSQYKSVGMHFTNQTIPGLIYEGVAFSGYDATSLLPNDKGMVAAQWIGIGNSTEIIQAASIDDSRENLKQIATAMEAMNINLLAIHLTKAVRELQKLYTLEELIQLGDIQFNALQSNSESRVPTNNHIFTCSCLP